MWYGYANQLTVFRHRVVKLLLTGIEIIKRKYMSLNTKQKGNLTELPGNNRRKYKSNEIDFFCTYIDGKCYLIPFDNSYTNSKVLRFIKPKNNQNDGITYAYKYELDKQIKVLL